MAHTKQWGLSRTPRAHSMVESHPTPRQLQHHTRQATGCSVAQPWTKGCGGFKKEDHILNLWGCRSIPQLLPFASRGTRGLTGSSGKSVRKKTPGDSGEADPSPGVSLSNLFAWRVKNRNQAEGEGAHTRLPQARRSPELSWVKPLPIVVAPQAATTRPLGSGSTCHRPGQEVSIGACSMAQCKMLRLHTQNEVSEILALPSDQVAPLCEPQVFLL